MKNWLFGLCAIGVFTKDVNTKLSGHLILGQAQLIIELHHGNVILIPSAAINHANSGILSNEICSSIVQYVSGGLLRWLWQNHKTEIGKNTLELQGKKKNAGNKRCGIGWDIFPKVDDL